MTDLQLDHVAVYATDVPRTAAFYAELLGLEDAYPGQWGGAPTILMAPGSRTGVAVFPAEGAGEPDRTRVPGVIDHFAFRTSRAGWEAVRERVRAMGVEHREQEFGICTSVFVQDPDGVTIEVTTYPEK